MRNHRFRLKCGVVWGRLLVALLLTLFALVGLTALAHAQRQSFRSPLMVSLQQAPSGRADLSWNPQNHVLTVTLHLSGLPPGSTHAAHIHAGTCSAKGNILYPFKNVVANATGNVSTTVTTKNVTSGIPDTGWNITVHQGATAETGDLLCGNVVNPKRAVSVSALLRATSP
ncbi:MAG: superoxide dismutase family protein [Ktedonobacteraceae bacterium]|nr:superoxide dismutase family protein [Ktedonobacteraceae bacterium]